MFELQTIEMHLRRSDFFRRRKKRVFANTSRGYKKAFNPRDRKRVDKYFNKASDLAEKMLSVGQTELYDKYLDLILGE